MAPEFECIWAAAASLGEGPLFDAAEQALYWVDIEKPAIMRYQLATGRRAEFAMPEKIGCIARRTGGGFVAGLQSGFKWIDLLDESCSSVITPIVDPEPARPGNRFNDGKCDAHGRFWAGTMDDAIAQPTGVLYRLDPDLAVHAMDDGYIVTNGPAFSPDGRTLYHNDSVARTVYRFDCDPATGAIDGKRVFARTGGAEGVPDGLTVDRDGGVWLAHWGGWRVTHFDPDGAVQEVLPLPVSQVTSCAFGGPDFDILFVTSARRGLTVGELRDEPLAGGLFAAAVGVRGTPPHEFAG